MIFPYRKSIQCWRHILFKLWYNIILNFKIIIYYVHVYCDFGKRYECKLSCIFEQWSKLNLKSESWKLSNSHGIDMASAPKLYSTKILFICLKCINYNDIKMHIQETRICLYDVSYLGTWILLVFEVQFYFPFSNSHQKF